jgi:hypothetical protein
VADYLKLLRELATVEPQWDDAAAVLGHPAGSRGVWVGQRSGMSLEALRDERPALRTTRPRAGVPQ